MGALSKEEVDYMRKALSVAVPHVPMSRGTFKTFTADVFRKRLLYGEIGKIRIAAGVLWGAGKEAAVEDWKRRISEVGR